MSVPAPWRDRAGRLSLLRAAAFAAVLAPGLWIAGALAAGALGAEPIRAAEHQTGTWALRFLIASLAVTPLRRRLGWSRLIIVRRMIGLAAFLYAAAHFGLYIAEQHWHLGRVAAEIASRLYLALGFVALLGLAALAATSFDRGIRALGRRWRRLHQAAYVIAPLALVHFALQEKLDVSQPLVLAGLWAALMLHRALARAPLGAAAAVVLVAVLSALLTAGAEYAWHATLTGLPADRILAANWDAAALPRPAWSVLALAAAPLAILAAQAGLALSRRRSRRPA